MKEIVLDSGVTVRDVTFKNRAIYMAGDLYLPVSWDASIDHPAIVVIHPGGGVKEQVAGLYAGQLAAKGFVALAFDASYQGKSGGEPRFKDEMLGDWKSDQKCSSKLTSPSWDGEKIQEEKL